MLISIPSCLLDFCISDLCLQWPSVSEVNSQNFSNSFENLDYWHVKNICISRLCTGKFTPINGERVQVMKKEMA